MAVRRHIVAGLNIDRDGFAEAFADLGQPQIEVTGPWTWFMASAWAVNADKLLERMEKLSCTALHMLTSDGCRWYLNLRGPGQEPFSTCYEFHMATASGEDEDEAEYDYEDEYDEEDAPGVVGVTIPVLHTVVNGTVQIAGDDFFNRDMGDVEDDEEEENRGPGETMAEDYAFLGCPLPANLVDEIRDLSRGEARERVAEWQTEAIRDALGRFGIAFEPDAVRDVLSGASVTNAEWSNDIGNLPRFLLVLGFGGTFQEFVDQCVHEEQKAVEDPEVNDPDIVLEMLKDLDACTPRPLNDGPVLVAAESVGLLTRLAQWISSLTSTGILAEGPCVAEVDPARYFSRHSMAWRQTEKGWHIWSSFSFSRAQALKLAHYIRALPDGARLEILFQPMHQDKKGQRYLGTVRNGAFALEKAYPQRSAQILQESIAFIEDAAERIHGAGRGLPWRADSEAQVSDVLALAHHSISFYNSPPRVDGLELHVRRGMKWDLAELFFLLRFRVALNLEEAIREEAGLVREMRKGDAEWEEQMSAPRTGVVLHECESIRVDEADVSDLEPRELRRLKSADRGFTTLGFTLLGNVCTPDTGKVIVRGYGHESGEAYGAAMLNMYGVNAREYFTHFHEGASLTTTTVDGIESIRRVGLFFRTSATKDLAMLFEEHRTGVAKLKDAGLTPKPAEPTLDAFARAVADAMHRRKLAEE